MTSLLTEVHNVFLFLKAVGEVAVFTGLAAGSLIAFGYELTTKRRA